MWAWDELVFLPPPTKTRTPHRSGHLGYIRGRMVDLGWALPSLHFHISKQDGEFVCMARGLLFEGSVLAYDPTTKGTEWIPMWGSASDLLLVEEASTRELSNIMPHDLTEVMQRMDHIGEQKGEGGVEEATAETLPEGELTEEAMELGYQPGSEGEADSNSMDSSHSPRDTAQHSSTRCCCWSSVSWVDQCLSESKDQHMPGSARMPPMKL